MEIHVIHRVCVFPGSLVLNVGLVKQKTERTNEGGPALTFGIKVSRPLIARPLEVLHNTSLI